MIRCPAAYVENHWKELLSSPENQGLAFNAFLLAILLAQREQHLQENSTCLHFTMVGFPLKEKFYEQQKRFKELGLRPKPKKENRDLQEEEDNAKRAVGIYDKIDPAFAEFVGKFPYFRASEDDYTALSDIIKARRKYKGRRYNEDEESDEDERKSKAKHKRKKKRRGRGKKAGGGSREPKSKSKRRAKSTERNLSRSSKTQAFHPNVHSHAMRSLGSGRSDQLPLRLQTQWLISESWRQKNSVAKWVPYLVVFPLTPIREEFKAVEQSLVQSCPRLLRWGQTLLVSNSEGVKAQLAIRWERRTSSKHPRKKPSLHLM